MSNFYDPTPLLEAFPHFYSWGGSPQLQVFWVVLGGQISFDLNSSPIPYLQLTLLLKLALFQLQLESADADQQN